LPARHVSAGVDAVRPERLLPVSDPVRRRLPDGIEIDFAVQIKIVLNDPVVDHAQHFAQT